MAKVILNPGTMLNPVPVVMVSCADENEKNIITVAWTGVLNSDPPMVYVSIRKNRHSHDIIQRSGEFVINLVNEDLVRACDYCGVKSGAKTDKWKDTGLTPISGQILACPMIKESPLNLECEVQEIIEYPSHDVFVAEIMSVHVDEELMDEKGRVCLERADLVAYSHGSYVKLSRKALGTFGFSVMKPKTLKKKRAAKRNAARRRNK